VRWKRHLPRGRLKARSAPGGAGATKRSARSAARLRLSTDPILFDDDALVDHARRMWDAESENASRLSQRVNLSLTVIAALFGLGLFKIEWYRRESDVLRVETSWVLWVVKGLLIVGVTLLGIALWRLLVRPPPDPEQADHASALLLLPQEFLEAPGKSKPYLRKVVFARTYKAASELHRRNLEEAGRIKVAQRILFVAFGILLVATVIFTIAAK
jgi:hypothetical protein